jgi:hypothetical protein
MLLSRRFNVEEIARFMGMPPILLGHSADGQTMWGTGVGAIITAVADARARLVLQHHREVDQQAAADCPERRASMRSSIATRSCKLIRRPRRDVLEARFRSRA